MGCGASKSAPVEEPQPPKTPNKSPPPSLNFGLDHAYTHANIEYVSVAPELALQTSSSAFDFGDGTLTVSLGNALPEDAVSLAEDLEDFKTALRGVEILHNGSAVAKISAGTLGSASFAVTFAAGTSLMVVQAVARSVGFRTGSQSADKTTRKVIFTFGQHSHSDVSASVYLTAFPPSAVPKLTIEDPYFAYQVGHKAERFASDAAIQNEAKKVFYAGKVKIATSGVTPDSPDLLGIDTSDGVISIKDHRVYHKGVLIGIQTAGQDGTTPLKVVLNHNASTVPVHDLLQRVTYEFGQDTDVRYQVKLLIIVTDGAGGVAEGIKEIDVLPEGDTPNLRLASPRWTYAEGAGERRLDDRALILESPDTFNAGLFTAKLLGKPGDYDKLVLQVSDTLSVTDNALYWGQVLVGKIKKTKDPHEIRIVLEHNEDLDSNMALQNVIRHIAYEYTSDKHFKAGARNIQFRLRAGGKGAAMSIATLQLRLRPVNVATLLEPLIDTHSYTENSGAKHILSGARVEDADTPDFKGGYVKVELLFGHNDHDSVTIVPTASDDLSIDGKTVSAKGAKVGSVSAGAFGSKAFTISFTSSAPLAVVRDIVRAVAYSNTSQNPTKDERAISVTVADGDGVDTECTISVNILAVNTAADLQLNADRQAFQEAGGPIFVSPEGTITDPDNEHFQGGHMLVSVVGGTSGTDQFDLLVLDGSFGDDVVFGSKHLTVEEGGRDEVKVLSYKGKPFGQVVKGQDGKGRDLRLNFTDKTATCDAVTSALRAITYFNLSGVKATRDLSLLVQLVDAGGAVAEATLVVTLLAENDLPGLFFRSPQWKFQGGERRIDSFAVVDEEDETNYAGGYLQMSIVDGLRDKDGLSLGGKGMSRTQVRGPEVIVDGVTVGTLAKGSSIDSPSFRIDLRGEGATKDAVEAIIRQLVFKAPESSLKSGTRLVNVSLADGEGDICSSTAAIQVAQTTSETNLELSRKVMTYNEGDGLVAIAPAGRIEDPNLDALPNGYVSIEITENAREGDSVALTPTVDLNGPSVTIVGTKVGTIVDGGVGQSKLKVQFEASEASTSLEVVTLLLRSLAFQNVSDKPRKGVRTLEISVFNGTDFVTVEELAVKVIAVNDPPALAFAEGELSFVQKSDPLAIGAGAVLTDPDSSTIPGGKLTVSLTAGAKASDSLDIAAPSQDSDVVVSGADILLGDKLIGRRVGRQPLRFEFGRKAPLSAAENLLQRVTFQNTADVLRSRYSVTITANFDDGAGGSVETSRTLSVLPKNDSPEIVMGETKWEYTEGQPARRAIPHCKVQDKLKRPFTGGNVIAEIKSGGVDGEDVLGLVNSKVLKLGDDGKTVTCKHGATFDKVATLAQGVLGESQKLRFELDGEKVKDRDVQTLLRHISYHNVSQAPLPGVRRIRFSIDRGATDGAEAGQDEEPKGATLKVTMTAVNDKTDLKLRRKKLTFKEGTEPVILTPKATIEDLDTFTFDNGFLRVSIESGAVAADKLALASTKENGVTLGKDNEVSVGGALVGAITDGSVDSHLFQLTFKDNRAATLKVIQTLLRAVTFVNTDADMTQGMRTITYVVNDGGDDAEAPQSVKAVVKVNCVKEKVTPELLFEHFAVPSKREKTGTRIAWDCIVRDADSPHFDGGSLQVAVAGKSSKDIKLGLSLAAPLATKGKHGIQFKKSTFATKTNKSTDTSLYFSFASNKKATPEAIQALIRCITIKSTSKDSARRTVPVSFLLSDGSGTDAAQQVKEVTFMGKNDSPTLIINSPKKDWIVDVAPTPIDPKARVEDPDNENYIGGFVKVAIESGKGPGDSLGLRTGAISVSGDTVTHKGNPLGKIVGGAVDSDMLKIEFPLTGVKAPLDAVGALIRSITFGTSGVSVKEGTRSIVFYVNDGAGGNSKTSVSIAVSRAVGDVAILIPQTALVYTSGRGRLGPFSGAKVLSDPSLQNGTITATLTGTDAKSEALYFDAKTTNNSNVKYDGKVVTFGSGGGPLGQVSGDGSKKLVIKLSEDGSLTPDMVAILLSGIAYECKDTWPAEAPRTVTVVLEDGDKGAEADQGSRSVTINVSPNNKPPKLSIPTTPINYVEGAGAVAVGVTVSDKPDRIFNGGQVIINIGNATPKDQVSIAPSAQIAVTDNGDVVYDPASATKKKAAGGKGKKAPRQVIASVNPDHGALDSSRLVLDVSTDRNCTLAAMQALLGAVTYKNVSKDPKEKAREVVVEYETSQGSAEVSRTVDVTAVNSAPSIKLPAPTWTYNETMDARPLVPKAQLLDDTDRYNGGYVSVSFTEGATKYDQLSIATTAAITLKKETVKTKKGKVSERTVVHYKALPLGVVKGQIGSHNFKIVFRKTDTVPRPGVAALIRAFAYDNTLKQPKKPVKCTKKIMVTVDDGQGVNASAEVSLDVVPTNDKTIVELGKNRKYREGDGEQPIAPKASINDPDSKSFPGGFVTVKIAQGAGVDDVIGLRSGEHVKVDGGKVANAQGESIATVTMDNDKQGLRIDFAKDGPTVSLAELNDIARNITFTNTSPTPVKGKRVIEFSVNDGDVNETADEVILRMIPINSPPELILEEISALHIEGSGWQRIANTIVVKDLDNSSFDGGAIHVVFAGVHTVHDHLELSSSKTLTVEGGKQIIVNKKPVGKLRTKQGSDRVRIVFDTDYATRRVVETVLKHISYMNSSNNPSSDDRVLRITFEDGAGGQAEAVKSISILPVNGAPNVHFTSPAWTYDEQAGLWPVDPRARIVDEDSDNFNGGYLKAKIAFGATPDDTLSISTDKKIEVKGTDVFYLKKKIGTVTKGALGSDNFKVTFGEGCEAPRAGVQSLLRHIAFENTSSSPEEGLRSLQIKLDDGDGGVSKIATEITVVSALSPVRIYLASRRQTYRQGLGSLLVAGGARVSCAEPGPLNGGTLTVSLVNGTASLGDSLVLDDKDSLTIAKDTVSHGPSLVVNFPSDGSATPEAVQELLHHVAFTNGDDPPTSGYRILSIKIDNGSGASCEAKKSILVSNARSLPKLALGVKSLDFDPSDSTEVSIAPAAKLEDVKEDSLMGGFLKVELVPRTAINRMAVTLNAKGPCTANEKFQVFDKSGGMLGTVKATKHANVFKVLFKSKQTISMATVTDLIHSIALQGTFVAKKPLKNDPLKKVTAIVSLSDGAGALSDGIIDLNLTHGKGKDEPADAGDAISDSEDEDEDDGEAIPYNTPVCIRESSGTNFLSLGDRVGLSGTQASVILEPANASVQSKHVSPGDKVLIKSEAGKYLVASPTKNNTAKFELQDKPQSVADKVSAVFKVQVPRQDMDSIDSGDNVAFEVRGISQLATRDEDGTSTLTTTRARATADASASWQIFVAGTTPPKTAAVVKAPARPTRK